MSKTETNGKHTSTNRITTTGGREAVAIAPLRQAILTCPLIGETPLKCLRFSQKKQDELADKHRQGDQAKTKTKKGPKDFESEYEGAKYRCTQKVGGKQVTWLGLNASGLRNACVETCRVAGYAMTKAKMSIFAVEDGADDIDGTMLVRVYGDEEMVVDAVRNASGVIDLRPRVMWRDWKIIARVRFDEDQFSPSDVLNLLIRVGQQNGLGEGRPNGTNGCGTGHGLFVVDVDGCKLERLSSKPAIFEG